MKRLYYLCDTLNGTESVSNDIHKAGINDWHFHVMSKDEAGLYKKHIHSSTIYQDTDVIHLGEKGLLIGLLVGTLALILASSIESLNAMISTTIAIVFLCFTSLFGAWLGGFMGIGKENYKVARFHDDLEQGKYLIIIDIKVGQEETVRDIMSKRHPDAIEKGSDTSDILPFEAQM